MAEQISFLPDDPSPKDSSVSPEAAPVDKDRVVAYAGHQHLITDRTLTLEQIRQMMERLYPELSKDRCEMTYNAKTGLIVPIVKGSRKGAEGR